MIFGKTAFGETLSLIGAGEPKILCSVWYCSLASEGKRSSTYWSYLNVRFDNKSDVFRDVSLLAESESQKDSPTSAGIDSSSDPKLRRSSSKWTDEMSSGSSTIVDSNQAGEIISTAKFQTGELATSDEMDLLMEQVKMLAGDIALSTSTLKRLVEQSVKYPESAKTQIQNLEREIQDKKRQKRVLEQRITHNGEASVANASLVDMQQTVTRLMTQCNEKSFELEIKAADNRILQEQLQNKCVENRELQEKIQSLEQQLSSGSGAKASSSPEQPLPDEYVEELKRKVQNQEFENEKLKLEHVQILEENSGLGVQNQKLSEEASYAKELA